MPETVKCPACGGELYAVRQEDTRCYQDGREEYVDTEIVLIVCEKCSAEYDDEETVDAVYKNYLKAEAKNGMGY